MPNNESLNLITLSPLNKEEREGTTEIKSLRALESRVDCLIKQADVLLESVAYFMNELQRIKE